MSGVNLAILIGRLGRDPEDGVFQSGDPFSNFSIAIDKKWKDKQGEPVKKTTWINIAAYGNLADICNKYLVKGSQVYIEGEIQIKDYDSPKDPEGSPKRKATKIIASKMRMLGSKGESESSGNSAVTERSASASAKKHRDVSSGNQSMEALHGDTVKDDSDIPF